MTDGFSEYLDEGVSRYLTFVCMLNIGIGGIYQESPQSESQLVGFHLSPEMKL